MFVSPNLYDYIRGEDPKAPVNVSAIRTLDAVQHAATIGGPDSLAYTLPTSFSQLSPLLRPCDHQTEEARLTFFKAGEMLHGGVMMRQ
jgi:hypothetical protein